MIPITIFNSTTTQTWMNVNRMAHTFEVTETGGINDNIPRTLYASFTQLHSVVKTTQHSQKPQPMNWRVPHRVRHLLSLHINPWPLTAQISFIGHWFGQAALHLARWHAKPITVSLLLTVSLHVDHQGRVIVMRRNLCILIRACTTSALIYGPVLQSQRLHLWLEGVSQCVKLTTMIRPH